MYQPTVGLEIHVELNTKSKMFCSCFNDPNERHPNINVCPICMGHPGTLPVINKEAVRKVIKVGLALNSQIPEYSKFERRHYFYPDLPKGYQISQYDTPLCKKGYVDLDGKKIRIRRIHLEEDVGKLVHPKGEDYSLVDFNRAGIPLMEFVTEPDLESAREARKFAEELQLIFRYLGVSGADLEKGEMRFDVNVSLQQENKLGTKVEIKNLNSFRALKRGIEYEIERQKKILESGKKIIQHTRGWDDKREITVFQRGKEEPMFSAEPNLPILHIERDFLKEIKSEVPEFPQQKRERFKKEYELSEKEIEIFVRNKDFSEYFEKVVSELPPRISHEDILKLIKLTSNYLITDLMAFLKKASVVGEDFLITPENFAEFITMIFEGKISSKVAKKILKEMFATGADPSHIVEEKGLLQVTDETEIEKIIKKVVSENEKAVEDFKKGKENAFQFLVGKVIQESRGRANPQVVNKLLNKHLTPIH